MQGVTKREEGLPVTLKPFEKVEGIKGNSTLSDRMPVLGEYVELRGRGITFEALEIKGDDISLIKIRLKTEFKENERGYLIQKIRCITYPVSSRKPDILEEWQKEEARKILEKFEKRRKVRYVLV